MKKFIAILMCAVMLISFGVQAFADDWQAMSEAKSYETTMEMWIEVNKPLEFLSELETDNAVDIKAIVGELSKSKIKSTVKADISDDMLSGKVYMSYNYLAGVDLENLKVDAEVKMHNWVDYNLTDGNNIKILTINNNILSGKYEYALVDNTALGESADAVIRLINLLANGGSKEINKIITDAAVKYATIEKDNNGYTVVSFKNDQIIDTVMDAALKMIESETAEKFTELLGVEFDKASIDPMSVAMVRATSKSLGIFADKDAYTLKFKADEKNNSIECEQAIHLDFNIAEAAEVLGVDEYDIYPVTKENGNVDFTLYVKSISTNINKDVDVQIPVLTEENSVNKLENIYYEDEYYYEEYEDYEEYVPQTISAYYMRGSMERSGYYVNVDDFLAESVWSYDNLTGTSSFDEEGNVVITLSGDYIPDVTITGNVNKEDYKVNSWDMWERKPFMFKDVYNWETYTADKELYVNLDILENTLGCKLSEIYIQCLDENGITLTYPEYYFSLVRPNGGYTK